jgi:glycine/D-amino acid oxidase-like deaminating enzyme
MKASAKFRLSSVHEADVIVVGAGFFGCEIALQLRDLGFERVVLLEREQGILRRASYVNQARVHNGYHYPRSLLTAQRSHVNFERFLNDYAYAVRGTMEMVYAIAHDSKVNPTQFERLCAVIDAPCALAPVHLERLFDSDLVEAVFRVREFAFDVGRIAERMTARLALNRIDLRLATSARVAAIADDALEIQTRQSRLRTRFLINATYADLDSIGVRLCSPLKRELAELVLIRPPPQIADLGVTVIDGPFFSTMPYPPARLHSLSHVRYTPHEAWTAPRTPSLPQRSNAVRMLRDATRYLPCLASAELSSSMFEIKAVLLRNERDDGRPILFEISPESPRIISILGAKLDNIYDAFDAIRRHEWHH